MVVNFMCITGNKAYHEDGIVHVELDIMMLHLYSHN